MDIPAEIRRLNSDLEKTTDTAERVAIRQQLTEYIKLLQQITPKPDVIPAWAITLQKIIVPLAREVVISQRRRLDVWTPSKTSRVENPDFKANLINFYQRFDPSDPTIVKCMILDVFLPKHIVIGSHIYKASTLGVGLEDFGLKQTDLFNVRNGLLLYESIEKAFDVKELCFLYNAFSTTLILHVISKDLLSKTVINPTHSDIVPASIAHLTFSDIHGGTLQLPMDVSPFKRILSWHARCSVRYGRAMGWLTEEEEMSFKPYFETSDGAREPCELSDPGSISL